MIDPKAANWRASIALVAADTLDAWCLPGGRCAVTRRMASLSEDRIAVAFAHELAHVLLDHPRERLVLKEPDGQPGAPSGVVPGAGANAAQRWVDQPYHRVHEVEADRLSVELLARAGFDPHASLLFWQAMNAEALPVQREQVPAERRPSRVDEAFLTRHPAPPSRLRDLVVYAERTWPFFEAARR